MRCQSETDYRVSLCLTHVKRRLTQNVRMGSLGNRLRTARQAIGLSQDQLADRLEISKASLSAWERGAAHPSTEKLPLIRNTLKVSLDQLICGPEAPAVREAPPPYVSEQQQLLAAIVDHLKALDAKQLRGLLGFLRASATG